MSTTEETVVGEEEVVECAEDDQECLDAQAAEAEVVEEVFESNCLETDVACLEKEQEERDAA